MTQLAFQFSQTISAMNVHAKQREAVRHALLKYGEVSRDQLFIEGLPECGRILNSGARILDLRKEGMQIKTEIREHRCYYVLTH